MRLTTFGDLLLDVIVQLEQPLVPGDDQVAVTRTGAGGQAANVAAWARALGADARYVGRRGDDAAGEIVAHELRAHGVELVGPLGGRTGVVVSIASAGDRTMASDRGAAVELTAHELEPAWFDCDVLHISGYSLLRDPLATAALRAGELARAAGAAVSLDVSTWTLVDDAFRARAQTLAPDTIFASERERRRPRRAGVRRALDRQARRRAVSRWTASTIPPLPVDVVDPTGAGDALAAGMLIDGPALGLAAAARCCAKLGSMP